MQGIWLVSYIALWVLVLGLSVALVAVGRYIGHILQQLSRTGIAYDAGSPAVGSQLWDDTTFPLGDLPSELFLAVFVSESCPHCRELIPQLGTLSVTATLQQVVLTQDPITPGEAYAVQLQELGIPYVEARSVFEKGRIRAVPTVVLVGRDGIVRDVAPGAIEAIRGMLKASRAA